MLDFLTNRQKKETLTKLYNISSKKDHAFSFAAASQIVVGKKLQYLVDEDYLTKDFEYSPKTQKQEPRYGFSERGLALIK